MHSSRTRRSTPTPSTRSPSFPPGIAGGYTRFLPPERRMASRDQLKAWMRVAMGGRVAEEITFGDITSGASDDLQRATGIARKMVTEWGMSESLGPRTFGQRQEMVFLGREISEQRDYGDKIADQIDAEINALMEEAHTEALDLLTTAPAQAGPDGAAPSSPRRPSTARRWGAYSRPRPRPLTR